MCLIIIFFYVVFTNTQSTIKNFKGMDLVDFNNCILYMEEMSRF